MAGDWIKIEHVTPDKPEVYTIAEVLDLDPDTVAGKLLRLWIWADQQSISGNALTVTEKVIDRITHQSGFSSALRKVGWLEVRSGSLQLPNFDRHNGQTSKNRAVTNDRVAKHRNKSNKSDVSDVTDEPLQKPLPEKRREEDLESVCAPARAHARRPTLAQAKSAAFQAGVSQEVAEEWWNARESTNWFKGTAGGGQIEVGSNWQADMKTYSVNVSRNDANKSLRRQPPSGGKRSEYKQPGGDDDLPML